MKRHFESLLSYLIIMVCIISHSKEVESLCSTLMVINRGRYMQIYSQNAVISPSIEDSPIEIGKAVRDKDEHFMRLALRHAQHSFREREVPIGAIIVDSNGVILATSRNQVEAKNDVTAHAEITCIRRASQLQKNWRLSGCILYSTLEPCPMCMGAIQASRITKVVYGASDLRMGACGSWVDLVQSKHPFHAVEVKGGLLNDESSLLLKRFFQMRRQESAVNKVVSNDISGSHIDISVSNDNLNGHENETSSDVSHSYNGRGYQTTD
mmetsp:Transcript_22390/g.21623  ORF Transcript_22390/g.21623 Transcript_22390/m.21623 type:complete len:267 (-) Transcript_22390:130-930(-)